MSIARSQGSQQNKPNYSTQPKRPLFKRQNVKQQQGSLTCGLNHHRATTCPAHKATCNFCGKKGQWEKVCITKQHRQKGKGQQTARCQPAARNKFNALEYAETSDSQNSDKTSNITFDSLEYSSLTGEELFATVRIQGERGPYNLRCKVDTGAPTSVISKRIYRKLYPNDFDKSGKLKDVRAKIS